jgi:protein-S-isoprenylcysteine O-methyltransferase Ste14
MNSGAQEREHVEELDKPGVLAPPPLLYLPCLILGLLLEVVLPLDGVPSYVSWPLGSVLVVAGMALGLWFFSAFRRAGTPVDVRRPTTSVVTDGPFRISRNPGYLSLTLIYLGVAVIADALWPVLMLPAILLVVDRAVIRREERYLERKFAQEYLRYKAATRRWV